ncbi:MAG: DMT family transporter [Massiliimalia sp.]
MKSKYRGILYILLAALCFSFMNLFVRMSGEIPSIQKSFFRNFVAVIFAAVILFKNRPQVSLDKKSWFYLILRSFFGTVGILCNFYAVDHLVLADASMLNKMSPFFAILFSYFLLKERVTLFQISAVVTAFVGALLIIKPTGSNLEWQPALIGLLGGMGAGIAYTMVRILGQRKVPGSFIVLFFSAFSCVVTLPFLIFDFHPMSWAQLACLLAAGLAAAGGQFSITAAYCCAPAKEISVYDYSQILFSAILGFIVFQQIPDGFSWLGYAVICGAAVAMFLYSSRTGQRTEKS